MLALYRLCWLVLTGPLLLLLWWRGRQDAGYRERWRERLALDRPDPRWRHGTVLHCASFGEALAARPLIHALLEQPDTGPLTVTCTTPTGARQLRKDFADRIGQVWFPFDGAGAPSRFLRAWQPRRVLLLEREVWPDFLHSAQRLGVPVALVNGRLSERSALGYRRWLRLGGPALGALRLLCVEDALTATRLTALGVPTQRLLITGNIKSDVPLPAALLEGIAAERAGLADRPVLTAGSTHLGEDESLLAAFGQHLARSPRSLLVLVPRHPERFDAVARLVTDSGLRLQRRSEEQAPRPDTQVLLVDRMGDLLHWYGVADACFVGGSLIPRGGHNPIEPLALRRAVITGPQTRNFEAMYAQLEAAGGVRRASDAQAVLRCFEQLLADPASRAKLESRGQAVVAHWTGATLRTLAALRAAGLLNPGLDAGAGSREGFEGSDRIRIDPALFRQPLPSLFDLTWWQQVPRSAESVTGGRGQLQVLSDGERQYLLRHYHRGGLMARLSRDLFMAQAPDRSRAFAEFALLQALRAQGLPVPRPCAARQQRAAAGLAYRADILVERIPGAKDAAALMHHTRALDEIEWQTLGRAVRRLHEAQVDHTDLNCHNLMLDAAGRAWIVDFDKCGFRPGDAWKADNRARLLRSLRKELRLDPGFRWTEATDWTAFLDGYERGAAAAAAAVAQPAELSDRNTSPS